jgi:hypothetical protein
VNNTKVFDGQWNVDKAVDNLSGLPKQVLVHQLFEGAERRLRRRPDFPCSTEIAAQWSIIRTGGGR